MPTNLPASLLDQPRLSRREAAAKLGVTPETIDRYCRVGIKGHKLPRLKIGGKSYILARDLERWVRATSEGSAPLPEPDYGAEHDAAMAECRAFGL